MFLEGIPIGETSGHTAGRQLLERMYRHHVGAPMPDIAVTERGKPYFVNDLWHFSISHSKGHVFCALSERPIGIDAEELDRDINLKLAEKVLSPMERQQFDRAADQRIALLTFWVLKEAQAKMTGEGLHGYPNHTEFMLTDPRVLKRQDCLVAVIEEEDHVI